MICHTQLISRYSCLFCKKIPMFDFAYKPGNRFDSFKSICVGYIIINFCVCIHYEAPLQISAIALNGIPSGN